MGILAKKLPEWSAEQLIEQFMCMDDKKLIWQHKSENFKQVKNAVGVLLGKGLARITAQNDRYVVYEYIGPEVTQTETV